MPTPGYVVGYATSVGVDSSLLDIIMRTSNLRVRRRTRLIQSIARRERGLIALVRHFRILLIRPIVRTLQLLVRGRIACGFDTP
jgi:hypothetical protein